MWGQACAAMLVTAAAAAAHAKVRPFKYGFQNSLETGLFASDVSVVLLGLLYTVLPIKVMAIEATTNEKRRALEFRRLDEKGETVPFPSCSRTGEYEHGTSAASLRSNNAVYRFIERNKEAYEKGRMVGQIVKRRIAKKSDGEHERGVAFADPKDLEEMERKGKKKKMMMKEKEPAAAKTEKRTTKSTSALKSMHRI